MSHGSFIPSSSRAPPTKHRFYGGHVFLRRGSVTSVHRVDATM